MQSREDMIHTGGLVPVYPLTDGADAAATSGVW